MACEPRPKMGTTAARSISEIHGHADERARPSGSLLLSTGGDERAAAVRLPSGRCRL